MATKLCKFADDLLIPAINVSTRHAELASIAYWTQANNLVLNMVKSQEILFSDKRRKEKFSAPAEIAELKRVQTIKILGVTVTNGLSVSPHAHSVIASCAQTVYIIALRVLRTLILLYSAV